jgi:predicted AlkP superfamily phosphohydrolase/phosphomutase
MGDRLSSYAMSRTVIIGLDGATFRIIEPLVQEGRLPALAHLMREGTSAPLRSTILPNSFPGWASCTTGTSEGMHGVFSPFIKNPSSYSARAMSGRDIMTRTIWDILSEEGGRSLVINVPTTYPPEPINGMMITGMLTPSVASDFTYPSSLKEELLAAVPAYVIEPSRHPDRRRRAEEFRHANDMHELAAHFLMSRGDWDFLMIVFSILDRAQHDYWADMDSMHPRHDPNTSSEFRNFIFEIYERLDGAIGRLIEKLPADVRVFIVSDHGFTSELYEVRVNELLAKAGLLTFKASMTRRARAEIKVIKEKIERRLFNKRVSGNVLHRKLQQSSLFLDEIDWSRTRAFFAQDKGVWINLAGREPQGIVKQSEFDDVIKEVQQALLELVSHDGEPVFERVMRREEAFNGLYRDRLPDLVMITRRDEYVYNERPGYGSVIVPADSTTGTHAREGILIAWGRGIRSGARFSVQPNLRDVGPTALYSLGCPLTEDMDGRLLAEIFSQQQQQARRASSYKQAPTAVATSVYSTSEEAELRERLRSLGYVE